MVCPDERTSAVSDTDRLRRMRPALELRSRVLQAIREFLRGSGFTEIETPLRIPVPATELHIDAEASGDRYLRTSPELHMKRLLAAGYERIFQMGPCFRRGERGRHHNPEYTMLEWYRGGADYRAILKDARALLCAVAREVVDTCVLRRHGQRIDLAAEWAVLTVQQAFAEHAGWDPLRAYDADRFDMDLVLKVEPRLPADRPVILIDYPVPAAALARCRDGDPPVAERWELYIGGLELANAFSELVDAREQRRRFEECAEERRRLGKEVYALDEEFLAALGRGMPPCGGAALGIDRLVMLLTGCDAIDEVRAFV